MRAVVLFGLAYMAPLIVLGTFGVLAAATNGATASAYVLALVAILFTAISYGVMVRAYPVSGSAYTYVRKAMDSRLGFLVGWATLLDYFFLPMVIWLIGAAYLNQAFPDVPSAIWVLAFIVVTTALNIIGLKLATLANLLLMIFQLLVLGLFVALSLKSVASTSGVGGWFSFTPFIGEDSSFLLISAGAGIAAYSFLGFDAVTTLTEETKDPAKTLPRAIMLIALIGGAIFILVSYTTQLVHPGGDFSDEGAAGFEIALQIGGTLFVSIFTAGLVVTQLAAGVAAQASASRLLYVMGRDGVLPKRFFGHVSEKFHTPTFSVLATGAVGLIALLLTVASSTSFIDFGAFTAFTFVNLSVIALYLKNRKAGTKNFNAWLIPVAILGAIIDIWLLLSLSSDAHVVGGIWLAIGVVWLAFLTKGFRRPPPEVGQVTH